MIPAKYRALDDQELVVQCLQGDALAWEALVLRYRRLIFSVPVRFNFSAADASDVFQAVCLKLIEHLHELKDERRVAAWLMTTTTRQCLHLRAQKMRERELDEESESGEARDPAKDLETLRIQTEQDQAVRAAVDQLPSRCRGLIEMLYFDARSPTYEEISQSLGMPVSSIGPTRARCLDKLRVLLRRKGVRAKPARE